MSSLPRVTSRPGFIPTLLGLIMLAEIGAARFALAADENLVYIFGHPINIVCAAKQRFGIPCPTCGFTRGFVLALHGNLSDAWRLSPSGPLFAFALAAAALLCFIFAVLAANRKIQAVQAFKKQVQIASLIYSAAGVIVWIATWVSVVRGMKL